MNACFRYTEATRRHQCIIASTPYFNALSACEVESIIDLVKIREVAAGTTIFLEGEANGEGPLYFVLEGTLRIYTSSLAGREQTMCLFHPGDTFGEIGLFDGGAHPVSADALIDSTIGLLAHHEFIGLMETYPSIAIAGARVLSKRLRHFSELIEDLSLRPVLGRVARLLLLENDEYLTQSQMASMIGSSREVVNRSLHRLEHDGIITINHPHVTVRDAAKLWRIVDDVKPARA